MPSAKSFKSKAVKCIKAIDDDQSVSLSMPTLSKTGKRTKCIPTMSISMSIDVETAMPTYYPTYSPSATPTSAPTHAPTAQPTTRRPTQRMVCQSGDFVDALGRDCFCELSVKQFDGNWGCVL